MIEIGPNLQYAITSIAIAIGSIGIIWAITRKI